MYIYKGKAVEQLPEIKNTKKIKVSLEDVLLTFLSSDRKGYNILVTYSISYFNIPQNIKEFEIERRIDQDSLKSVINETVGDLGRFITIYSLSSKQVVFLFDSRKFIESASYPSKVVNQRKINQTVLKLNQKLPDMIYQTSGELVTEIFSTLMTTMVRNDRKFMNIFSRLHSWVYSKNAIIRASYNINDNSFFIEVTNPFRLYYYYM